MNKELEDYLWNNFGTEHMCRPSPRSVIDDMVAKKMIDNPKQAHHTLVKWLKKGIYNYGTCLDLGWKELNNKSKAAS